VHPTLLLAFLKEFQFTLVLRKHILFAIEIAVLILGFIAFAPRAESQQRDTSARSEENRTLPQDVTVSVRVWPYRRIFPLLDGLFQDVAATQIKNLSLDPNGANGTNLDALQQAFQLQVQYSATAGIQNSVAAQQASAASATALMQTQLISRQSQLIQSQLIAQNQAGIAQKTVDTLSSNGASSSDLAAAKLQLQLATDNLNAVTAQLSDIKSQLSTVSTPTFAAPTANFATTPPTLPSSLSGPANVPSAFSPNFPATKQMDNQMTLLWERLGRLVYTLNETAASGNYYLLQVDTGIVPIKRKHQMLVTHYQLSCGDVVDIYPRLAAVNIIDEKYKETRLGLAGLISFFSLGLNASYNRDHLKITQMLGQSSYITGYGVGTRDFGWAYGLTLGEDTISPGTRGTFVLVRADCDDPKLNLVNAEWVKQIPATNFQGVEQKSQTNNQQRTPLEGWKLADSPGANPSAADPVKTISYTPVEDDPANATPTAVMVSITLADNINIDPETTITADGILVNRIRDTFGRAITGAGAGGSGGVLEVTAAQLQLNTWIPVNSHELILNLNPRSFRGHFPTVLMQSPRGITELRARQATVQLQGRNCEQCRNSLPPLSYPKVAISNLTAARWMFWSSDPSRSGTGKVQYDNLEAKIVINAVVAKGSTAAQGFGSPAPLQVIDDANSNPWGSSPRVRVVREPNDTYVLALNCQPFGPQLVCPSPRMVNSNDKTVPECISQAPCLYTDGAYQLEVIDDDHLGGAFHGRGMLAPCGTALHFLCSQPLIWKMDTPIWTVADDGWRFNVFMINVAAGQRAQLNRQPPCQGTTTGACRDLNQTFDCPVDGKICRASFVLRKESLPSYQDSMELQVYPDVASSAPVRPITIGGVRSQLNPVLTTLSSDSTQMTGNNLVFDQLMVGVDGKPIPMTCSRPTDCTVTYPTGTKKGYLNFIAQAGQGERGLVPVMLQQAQGIAKVLYTPSEKPAAAAPGGATPQVVQPAKPQVPLSSSTE
jgi:hypothetical protein